MDYHSKSHVLTLANSIIGVSVLAMPYCFKQCGIILAVITLIISSIISRLACHFLLKSAIIARRRTFENLAFYIFGKLGKFLVEVGMIGFLIGTCIAFFVVIGDLGPEIVSEITGTTTSNTMRTSIIMAIALFCVLPLGLLRNVDSLVGVSQATIGFYVCLVLKIIAEAIPHIFSGDWYHNVVLWQPAGIIQCIPIFSMALSCQTQLFEIYQVLHNPTLEKMNDLVRVAVNICTVVYIFVGFFGYIAVFHKPFMGNILLSFSPSIITDIMKIGFVLSLAFSFPLVIFPCRVSLHSLLYKEGFALHEGISNYIPEAKFKSLTLFIVFVSLIFGILMPNIEFVLGLIGSTIGIAICILFPVAFFIHISEKNTNERILAKIMLFVGIVMMILGTYENLIHVDPPVINVQSTKQVFPLPDNNIVITTKEKQLNIATMGPIIIEKSSQASEIRHEPPQPIEPQETLKNQDEKGKPQKDEKAKIELTKDVKEIADIRLNQNLDLEDNKIMPGNDPQIVKLQNDKPVIVPNSQPDKNPDEPNVSKENEVGNIAINLEIRHEPVEPMEPDSDQNDKKENSEKILNSNVIKNADIIHNEIVNKNPKLLVKNKKMKQINLNNSLMNEIDIEAIKKDDKEANMQESETEKHIEHDESHQKLIDTIQKQNEFQKEIVAQQKKLIAVIENQQKELRDKTDSEKVNEEKLKAVKQIESIALKAIQEISGKDDKKVIEESEQNIKNKVADSYHVESEMKNEVNEPLNTNNKNHVGRDNKTNDIKSEDSLKNEPHKNNTAPLFLNLGQKNVSKDNPLASKPNLSLPIPIISNSLKLNNTNSKNIIENSENIPENIENKINKIQITNGEKIQNNNVPADDDVKAIRRDILSYTAEKMT